MADTIPAMLEPGEYVLNRNAARAIGKNKLDELNFEQAPRDLLSRTQGGDYTIPAGKNIFGQPTEKMGMEELLEMIMPMGSTKWAAKLLSKKRAKEVLPIAEKEGKKSMKRFVDSGSKDKASEMSDVFAHRDYTNFLKEYIKKGASYFPEGFQRGGSVDDYSLMDYMMPAMDKRLGPPLRKMQRGGDPNDPKYTHYLTQMSLQTQPSITQQPQQLPQQPITSQDRLIQPSGSFSTNIGSIFQEAGYQTPESEYLETLGAYDPTKQQRLQEDYAMKLPGPIGGAGGFAGSGAAIKKAGEQREQATGMYQRGAEDLRQQYREDIMAQIAEDVASGTYTFDELT
jgi:hypothetical protein